MKTGISGKDIFGLILAVFWCFSPLYGAETQRNPMDVNLIIDGSGSFSGVKNEIIQWVSRSLVDQTLIAGDKITIWSAGAKASVIYSARIKDSSDKETLKKNLQELSASGDSADFSGALREAASAQSSGLCYTLLISSSPAALSSALSGPQSNLLRFSRVEEFPGWRVLVVGLNIDAKVKRAASAFFGS